MRRIIHEMLDYLLAKYTSDEIGELVEEYECISHMYSMEEAWSRFVDRFELGNWIYEQAIMADINLPEFLIDTQAIRSLQEQEAAEARAELELECRGATL